MIKVILKYLKSDNPDNKKVFSGFEVSGHADYAEHGEDIVCAAVSVLSINTANALTELTSNNVDVSMDESGYLKVTAKDELDSYGDLLMDAFVMGILNTYDEYLNEDFENEFINIEFKEV